jgi:hypothetical protein
MTRIINRDVKNQNIPGIGTANLPVEPVTTSDGKVIYFPR